jgi:tetratricopeptide repeat protein 21B
VLIAQEASMMLADVMFRKEEHDAATYHFQQVRHSRLNPRLLDPHLVLAAVLQLLEKNPTQYAALSKLIQLLRRAGRYAVRDVRLVLSSSCSVRRLTDAPKFIKQAEKSR